MKGLQGDFQLVTSFKNVFLVAHGNSCSHSEEKCIFSACLDSTSDPCNEAQAQAGWDLDGL